MYICLHIEIQGIIAVQIVVVSLPFSSSSSSSSGLHVLKLGEYCPISYARMFHSSTYRAGLHLIICATEHQICIAVIYI
jgi:hypothetical protein